MGGVRGREEEDGRRRMGGEGWGEEGDYLKKDVHCSEEK